MTRDKHQNGVCGQIDEEAFELHAMGRLEDGSLRKHMDMCASCQGRVAEHRSWIEDLKIALEQFRQAEDMASPSRVADCGSRQDES